MQTPPNRAGELTERIMPQVMEVLVQHGIGPLTASQYNRIYETIYETLDAQLKGVNDESIDQA